MTVKSKHRLVKFASVVVFVLWIALTMALASKPEINFLSAAIVVAFLFFLLAVAVFMFLVMPPIMMNWASNKLDSQKIRAKRLARVKKREGVTNED